MKNAFHNRQREFGFTLVELLVVIGIIALLISILLPALSKAREQAAMIKCQANMRSIYQLMQIYSTDNRQAVMPAQIKTVAMGNVAVYWWSPGVLGTTMHFSDSSTAFNQAEQAIAKILYCPSASHDLDVTGAAAGTGYYGDYTYNHNLGDFDYRTTPATINVPMSKTTQVPENVVVLTEINKSLSNQWQQSVFLHMGEMLGVSGASQPNKMNTPHARLTKANFLFADGHISLLSPNDFIKQPCQIITSTPWSYLPSRSTVNSNQLDYLVGYYNGTYWYTPWKRGVPAP